MNKFTMVIVALLSLGLLAQDADARRLGGGTSVGTQRQMITQPAPKAPAQAPAAAPASPVQQPQPSGMSKWLGPLAGLALGAGLASLFMGSGMAGAFGGILMILLVVAAAIFVVRMLRPKPQSEPLQYAGVSAQDSQPGISNMFGGGAALPAIAAASPYPAGFDAGQFVRHAKINFTRLQAAHDQRDMSTMQDFMTPGLYAEIAAQVDARSEAQKTDVVTLDAQVLEVVTEGDHYVASVHFSGMIREGTDAPPEPFSEIWHLEKPVSGDSGWLIAGIQQA